MSTALSICDIGSKRNTMFQVKLVKLGSNAARLSSWCVPCQRTSVPSNMYTTQMLAGASDQT
eukprot:1415227-Amphidinium_carterae.2